MLLLLVMRIWQSVTITPTLVTNLLRLNRDCKEVLLNDLVLGTRARIGELHCFPTNQQTMDQVPAQNFLDLPKLDFFQIYF